MSPNGEEWIQVANSSSLPLELKRPNFPFNCFTFDLTENDIIKNNVLKYLWFDFYEQSGTSVEIKLQDKKLASSRQIIEDTFYFSGPRIRHSLGKTNIAL